MAGFVCQRLESVIKFVAMADKEPTLVELLRVELEKPQEQLTPTEQEQRAALTRVIQDALNAGVIDLESESEG